MQRSRRALLQRRAIETSISTGRKQRLYKVSLSLVVVSWGLVFLLNLWIGHGNGYRDGSGVPVGELTWHEAERNLNEGSDSEDKFQFLEINSKDSSDTSTCSATAETKVEESLTDEKSDFSICTTSNETKTSSSETVANQENESYLSSVKEQGNVEIASDLGGKTEKDVTKNDGLSDLGEKTEKDVTKSDGLSDLGEKTEKDVTKSDRLSRAAPLGLDEFKSRSSSPKGKPAYGHPDGVVHRVETGGVEYNYASASKGAKVLAFNKEANGASNILGKDKDKYLRNPCSAEAKFVVIELSEETLVDTIELANFEHYSSNLKEFELLGSLVYPTDKWFDLGNFTARNVKQAQRFTIEDPKWVRYLKLNMLNHHGSEFYCTLSAVGVYGVDAVERMLEDLIADQDNQFVTVEPTSEQAPLPPQPEPVQDYDEYYCVPETEAESGPEKPVAKPEVPKNSVRNPVLEKRPQQVGRMPGDAVLKILLQKVRSLDLSLFVLERYLEDLNTRYGHIFKELDNEIDGKAVLLEKIRGDIKNLLDSEELMAKDVSDLITWKSLVSLQMYNLVKDNSILRSEVESVLMNQKDLGNKSAAIFLVSLFFGCLAVLKLFVDLVVSVSSIQKSGKFCGMSSAWLVLLLSCSIVVIIVLL